MATLFKRLLGLERERVVGLETVGEGAEEEVVIDLARRTRRRMRCGRCGRVVRGIYDRSTRSWRHLDLVRVRCTLRAEVRRVSCPDCGAVAEEVPWIALHEELRGRLRLAVLTNSATETAERGSARPACATPSST